MKNYNLDFAIRETVIAALTKNAGCRAKAARDLGVSVRSVRNYMVKYNLKEKFPVKVWPSTRDKLSKKD